MRLSATPRVWVGRIGALLGLAGLAFVGLKLHGYATQLGDTSIGAAGYAGLAGLAILYGAANILLAVGWRHLLNHVDVPVSQGWAFRAYAISQLAKYVPGNIFQFAGRQAIGVAAGIGNAPLAKSTGLELAVLAIGGALFLPLTLPLAAERLDLAWPAGRLIEGLIFALLVGLALWLAGRLAGRSLLFAAAAYLAFLAVSGAIFCAVMVVAGGVASPGAWPSVAGAYVIAWLAGLVTPGAPAGLGVREAVLLFLLGGIGTAPVILLAVLAGRAVTVLGDLGFWAAGSFVTRDVQSGSAAL